MCGLFAFQRLLTSSRARAAARAMWMHLQYPVYEPLNYIAGVSSVLYVGNGVNSRRRTIMTVSRVDGN
jgi:hypothetical protein